MEETRLLKKLYLEFCSTVTEYRNEVAKVYFKMNYATFQNKMSNSKWYPVELVGMADAMNISDEDLGKIVRQEAKRQKMNEI